MSHHTFRRVEMMPVFMSTQFRPLNSWACSILTQRLLTESQPNSSLVQCRLG